MRARVVILLLAGCAIAVAGDEKTDPANLPTRQEVVVVTGTFEPLPLEEADRAVTTLPTREQPLLFPSIVDYLRLEPSLDLRERAPGGVQTDVSIRGAGFGQTLVLINGMRVNDAQSGHHNLDQPVPLQAVERVEVLRGAGSTLYGADAVGGAVNLIVKPPPASEFRAGAAFGNLGINQQWGSATYSSERFAEQLSGSRDFSTGFMPDRDYRNLQTASVTRARTALGNSALLLAYSDKPFGADQFYGNYNSWERTKAWLATVTQDLGSKTEASFGFRRHTDEFVLWRDRPWKYTNHHETQSWQSALRRRDRPAQNVTVSYGAEAFRDSIASDNVAGATVKPALGTHARNRAAVYANLDVRALRRFSFSVGGREEVYGSLRTNFNPSVSAGYWLSSKWKLRGAASRAFRLPTYTDLYYSDPATRGNADLQAESAWSYESGLDWNGGGIVSGTFTGFHRRERNGIDYVQRSPSDPVQYATNLQNLNFTGVEAALRVRLPRAQQVEVAYTGITGERDSAQGNLKSRYLFNYLADNGSMAWQGRLPGGVVGRTRLGVMQRRSEEPYALWDLALTRAFGHLSAFVQFSNLADTRYAEITVPVRVPMPGRTVVGGMNVVVGGKK